MKSSALPHGEHYFEDVLRDWRAGHYRFAQGRSASGRLHLIIGVSPEQWRQLRALAKKYNVALILSGSRVVGPRTRQVTFHPAIASAMPLEVNRRLPSLTYPAINNVRITKETIKELGFDNPLTSDINIEVLDPKRPPHEHRAIATAIAHEIKNLDFSFPVRVNYEMDGIRYVNEKNVLEQGVGFLKRNLPQGNAGSDRELEAAFQELYIPINLRRSLFSRHDFYNGVLLAALDSVSFGLTLGFHPIIPITGLIFGLIGRYLARLRSSIAFHWGDTVISNFLAILTDAAIGISLMTVIVNPIAGYGITLQSLAATSLRHTLARGTLRLFVDKIASVRPARIQALGVSLTITLNFFLGILTGYVYAGRPTAYALQTILAVMGTMIIFGPPLRKAITPRV
ncbi:MAG: hypothetical protein HY547_03415 [Elusimicrobia bacterium]|nr:hypothetical protein [Elusimicrobiota bacterium]